MTAKDFSANLAGRLRVMQIIVGGQAVAGVALLLFGMITHWPVESAPLPPGKKEATVSLNPTTTPPHTVYARMQVDVVCHRKDEKGSETTETVLKEAFVVGKEPQAETKNPYKVRLAVTEEEAEKLTQAEASGEMRLVTPTPIFTYVALGVLILLLILHYMIPPLAADNLRFRLAQSGADAGGDSDKLLGIFQNRLLMATAFLEGAAILLGIAYILEGQRFAWIGALVPLGLLALQFPLLGTLERFLDDQKKLLAEERKTGKPAKG